METILQTTNLSRQFGKKMAVNNVNMTIHKGDIYGFIGKNGAGKTTFMRLVLGTAFPTKGEIKLFDGEPFDKARRKIGSLIEAERTGGLRSRSKCSPAFAAEHF